MEKFRYHEMLPHEITARRATFPAAFIGLGVLEWHGEHMAVGNDGLKAEKLCELAAARSGGFAFPSLWYSVPRQHQLEYDYDPDGRVKGVMGFSAQKITSAHYRKTPAEQVSLYQDIIFQLLLELNALEMKAACLLTGHYPLIDWVGPVVEEFNALGVGTRAFAGIETAYPNPPDARVGGDHAAKWETSYLWYLRPDCVDMSIFLSRPEEEPPLGVYGDNPRKTASVEVGRAACELIVAGMLKKAAELIQGR